jgi:glycosyltransferase involved in cell wall biosynthesis
MYLTAAPREVVARFDEEHFPKGYGEENDYCLRTSAAGFIHLIDDATYVFHRRSASFGEKKEAILEASLRTLDQLHPHYKQLVAQWDSADLLDPFRAELQGQIDRGGSLPGQTCQCLLVIADEVPADAADGLQTSDIFAREQRLIVLCSKLNQWTTYEYFSGGWVPIRRYEFSSSQTLATSLPLDGIEVLREICADYRCTSVELRQATIRENFTAVVRDLGLSIVSSDWKREAGLRSLSGLHRVWPRFFPRSPSVHSAEASEVAESKNAAPARPEEYPLWAAPWRAWNQMHEGTSYTLEVYPDAQDGSVYLHGWWLDSIPASIRKWRIVVDGRRVALRHHQIRRDAALLYPDRPEASRSGFRARIKRAAMGAGIELQVARKRGQWITVTTCILKRYFATQWKEVIDLVVQSGLFDVDWYARNGAAPNNLRAAVSDYLRAGAVQGRDPNALFFSEEYWNRAPEALQKGANPLLHYLARGASEGVRPNRLFDSRWYLHRYDEAQNSGLNPLAHYLRYGSTRRFNPSVEFNTRFYVDHHPELRHQKIDPLVHYIYKGSAQGFPATPELDECWHYRGPRFDPTIASAQEDLPRRRVAVVGHLLGSKLFGSENSLIDLLLSIDPKRFDLFAVFPGKNEHVFARIKPHVQGICVLNYFWWHKELPFQEKTVRMFERLYRELAIDLVHVNTIMLTDPHIAAQRAGIPSIAHVRELISGDETLCDRLGANHLEIATTVCKQASYLLANSAATLADYPCPEKASYVYNSVDLLAFDFPNEVDARQIKIGLVSSNVPKKGVSDFLELARRAEKVLPTLEFHLIGPETNLIEQWRQETGLLPANFHVHDYVSNPPDAYRSLNLVLNLSHFAESFGRTVAEAMAARRPVIAYQHGALPELVDEGKSGFLVPYLDLAAVLDRVRFFAENPELILRFGEEARARIQQRCCSERAGQIVGALYERLITKVGR